MNHAEKPRVRIHLDEFIAQFDANVNYGIRPLTLDSTRSAQPIQHVTKLLDGMLAARALVSDVIVLTHAAAFARLEKVKILWSKTLPSPAAL
jgi:hypothetical protein